MWHKAGGVSWGCQKPPLQRAGSMPPRRSPLFPGNAGSAAAAVGLPDIPQTRKSWERSSGLCPALAAPRRGSVALGARALESGAAGAKRAAGGIAAAPSTCSFHPCSVPVLVWDYYGGLAFPDFSQSRVPCGRNHRTAPSYRIAGRIRTSNTMQIPRQHGAEGVWLSPAFSSGFPFCVTSEHGVNVHLSAGMRRGRKRGADVPGKVGFCDGGFR